MDRFAAMNSKCDRDFYMTARGGGGYRASSPGDVIKNEMFLGKEMKFDDLPSFGDCNQENVFYVGYVLYHATCCTTLRAVPRYVLYHATCCTTRTVS